ncbi:tyrosine-type recombinase/integrase [Feifania hominis]
MSNMTIHTAHIAAFERALRAQERSAATVEKYLRDVRQFAAYLGGAPLTREAVAGWKSHLLEQGRLPTTVNGKLAVLSSFLSHLGRRDCRVRQIRLQRRLFRDQARELGREEYERLVAAARQKEQPRLALLLETICATGIRVSELRDITVEAAAAGRAQITLKGKTRVILLPGKLCRKLLKYARRQKIASGEIFLTRGGKSLNRRQIWAQMKALCSRAGVEPGKVFPHNLRHLFARCFYRACRDIARLSDVLGHSSMETTRIYLISTGAEHARTLEQLRLVS